jgi:hypothetical protein
MVMKRFYIKRISDHIMVVHRPTHQIIMTGKLNEKTKKKVKDYIKMGTEDFYKELNSLGLKFKTKVLTNEEMDIEKEDWYKKAWLSTTKQVLKHFKIKEDSIPDEDMPLEFIKQLQKEDTKGWGISAKEETKEAPEEKKVLKKVKKLPKKVKNKKVAILVPYKTKQEVRRAYSGGEIDTETYKKYMRALR